MKRKRAKPGDVFAIALGDGSYGFGQVCWKGLDCAFFDVRGQRILSSDEVLLHSVAFRITPEQSILKSGKWPIIGHKPLSGALAEPESYRNQPVGSNQLYLYRGGEIRPATLEEVKDFELLAIWFEEHIVERLLDHFARRPNRTVDFFRRIKSYAQDGRELPSSRS